MWAGAGNCPAHFYIRALHSRALQRVPEPQRKKPLQSIATAFYDFGQKRNRIPLCSRPIFRKRTNKKTNKNKSDPLVARLKHITAGAAGRSARRGAWGAVAAPHHGSLFSRASSAKVVAKQRALCNRGFQPSTRACCVPGALSFFGCDDGRTSSASAQSDFKSSWCRACCEGVGFQIAPFSLSRSGAPWCGLGHKLTRKAKQTFLLWLPVLLRGLLCCYVFLWFCCGCDCCCGWLYG